MEGAFAWVEAWLLAMGPGAYVVAPMVMAFVAVLPIPAEAPAFINGAIFGPLAGTAITWIGAVGGAWISFEISRSLGRPVASRLVRESVLDRVDETVDQAGWTGLLVLRLLPVVAFTAINWGAGLTSVSRWRFLWTTALGIVPGAIVFTASGSGAAALIRRGTGPAAWFAILAIVGFLTYTFMRSKKSRSRNAQGQEG